jgi:hypothetical protein
MATNFSAPKRRSLPTPTGVQDQSSTLAAWQSQLNPLVSNVAPQPTPSNFSVTNARGGLQLSWAPVNGATGYEILKSQNGSFTDDLAVIPISGASNTSHFDSLGGASQTAHYRIRTIAGDARGPESGVVSHTSLDSADSASTPTTVQDKFTNDKVRSLARLGNYGAIQSTSSAGNLTGTNGASNPASSVTPTGGTPSVPAISFGLLASGTNTSAQMTVAQNAEIIPDPNLPGVISATHIQGNLVSTATPADGNVLAYSSTDGEYDLPTNIFVNPGGSGNILPAASNTTQSIGSASAPWNGVFGVETVGKWNAVRIVDGVKFTTIAAAQADLPSTGGVVLLPPGYRETINSHIDLGSATQPVILFAYPDVVLTGNVTDGTYLFNIHNGSGIVGSNVGSSPSRNGGFTIQLASTANVTNVLDTGDKNTAGGQAYLILENFFLQGHPSAVVSNAMVNIENVLGQARTKNIYVLNFANCYGIKCTTNVNATGTGPLLFDNIWVDGQANTGAKPVYITTNGSTMLPVDWIGGVVNHPGAGCNSFEVNGNGIGLGGCVGMRIHTYFEKLTGSAAISLRLRDVVGVDFSGCAFVLTDADTAIDISESAANKTAAIQGNSIWKSSPTNAATLLNNHITGETTAAAILPFYNFGGEASTSCAPFSISANDVQVFDRSGNSQYSFTLDGNPTFRNFQDAQFTFSLDSGKTTTQNSILLFRDRGTDEWSFGKDSTNVFLVRDRVNSKNHLILRKTSGTPTVELGGNIAPTSAGLGSAGTSSLPFSDAYIGTSATNNIRITGSATAARSCTLPDANSNPVQPDTGAAHNFLTAISSTGVISKTRPAAADLSDTATSGNVLRGNGTSFVSAQLAGTDLSDYAAADYSPTNSGFTTTGSGFSSVTGKYTKIGRMVHFIILATVASASTVSSTAGGGRFSLPIASTSDGNGILSTNNNNGIFGVQIHGSAAIMDAFPSTFGAAGFILYCSGTYFV